MFSETDLPPILRRFQVVTVDDLPPAPPRQDDDEPSDEDGQVEKYYLSIASTLSLHQEDSTTPLNPTSPPVEILESESQFAAEIAIEQVSSLLKIASFGKYGQRHGRFSTSFV